MNKIWEIKNRQSGLSLLDILIATAMMLVVFLAIASAFRVTLSLTFHNKAKAGAVSLANEKMELMRSIAYVDVGTLGGIPSGTVAQTENITLNGVAYIRRTFVAYVDAPEDGIGALDTNNITTDYKVVKIEVTWSIKGESKKVSLVTNFIPNGIESNAGGGTLIINILNAASLPVVGANVLVVNNTVNPAVSVNTFTDTAGKVVFPGTPSASEYEITVTKSGYSTAYTYKADASNPNPDPRHLSVLEGETTVATFQIDLVASKRVNTFEAIKTNKWSDSFDGMLGVSKFASTTIGGGLSAGVWYDSAWGYRKKITIDNTKVSGSANLTSFPVLLNLTDSNLAHTGSGGNVGKINGGDILFTSSDKVTKLDHEIEAYTSANGNLVAWVNIPVLSYNTDTEIYLYYGNASASNQENAPAVWSNGYEAVYHLHDDFNDSKGAHSAVNSGSVDVSALAGDGQDFESNDLSDKVDIGTWSISGSAITIQSWVKFESFAYQDARIISKANGGSSNDHVYMLSSINSGGGQKLRFRLKTGTSDSSGTDTLVASSGNMVSDTWYLAAATYDGSNMRLILDGVDVGSVSKTGSLRENSWFANIGNNPSSLRSMDGVIDETRVSSVARSVDWLKTEYNNQISPSTFYSLTAQESFVGTGALVLLSVGSSGYVDNGNANSATVTPAYLFKWQELSWNDTKPTGTDVKYKVYDASGVAPVLLSDVVLPGNSAGFGVSPVNISGLSTTTYPALQAAAFLSLGTSTNTPSVLDWEIKYKEGPIPFPNVSFNMRGDKTIGTDISGQLIYKYTSNLSSDSGSTVLVNPLEWDSYTISSITATSTASLPTSNMVAHFKLDETSGTVANDSTTNNNDGTLSGGPTWASGKVGGALDFDGVDDYVHTSSFDFGATNTATLSAWVKNNENTAAPKQGIIYKNSAVFEFFMMGGSLRTWIANGTSWHGAVDSPVYSDWDTWHHIAAVYDGANVRIYRDGVEVAVSGSETGNFPPSNTYAWVGRSSPGEYWNGSIDDVRIYNRALSATEVNLLFGGGVSANYDTALSCNPQPASVSPGSSVTTDIHIATSTTNSLLVAVKNSAGVLLDDVSVRLYRTGFDFTQSPYMCGQTFFNGLSSGTVSGGNSYSIDLSLAGYSSTTITGVDVSGASSINTIIND